MERIVRHIIFLVLLFFQNAHAGPNLSDFFENPKLVGEGTISFLFFDFYKARLYAPSGNWESSKPMALELNYLREISKEDIVEITIEEIIDLGFTDKSIISNWTDELLQIFPNVDDGTQITGIKTKENKTLFFLDEKEIGSIDHVDFSKYFFDIWLHENTKVPKLRKKLLNLKADEHKSITPR